MRCLNTTIVIVVLAIFWPVLAGSAQEAKILPLVQGEIKKVDESADKITIKHAAIPKSQHGWHDYGV